MEAREVAPEFDTTKPHSARMYNYYLGGKDNFAVDRETAERTMLSMPTLRTAARANRGFLARAVRFLVAEAGIRQFLDIGTGLPSANNVHEVAQAIAPECRVVYTDNDPLVLAHARALLTGAPGGLTAYIEADLREPERILANPVMRETLDFSQPIALLLIGILHFVSDEDNPARIVSTLVDALPPGSYFAASHGTEEYNPQAMAGAQRTYREAGVAFQARSSAEFAELAFEGLEILDPGVVPVSEWRPGSALRPHPSEVNWNGAVARKPLAPV